MELLSKLKPGDVLGQVDLASYIGAMGKGVAEAQRALDDNTIGLLGQFTKKIDGLAGKSLIELGLSPAFYHFRSATISASVSMSIRVRQEIDVSVHVEAGMGQGSSAASASGSKRTTSAHESVTFSDNFVAHTKSAQSASAMEAIDSYAEDNSESSTRFVLAERLAVAAADKAELTGAGLVVYSSAGDLYAVPPAGQHWAVIRLAKASAAGEQYEIKANAPYAPDLGTAPADLAVAIKGQVKTAYILSATASGVDDLREVLFDTNSHIVKPIGSVDYSARLRALARIILAANLGPVTVTGHTDGVGPTGYNKRLSELRADSVRDVLVAYGVAVNSATGLGESGAADNVAASAQRWARIGLKAFTGYLIYVEDDPGALSASILPQGSGTDNGRLASGSYDPDGLAITNRAAVTSAAQLVQRFTATDKVEASQSGELVYLTYSQSSQKEVAKVQVYATQSSSQETEGSSNLDVDQGSSADTSAFDTSETETNRAVAVAGSLDVRFSRMFDVSMAGNMSIAAELVSIPAPPEFLQFIKDHLGD